MPNVRISDLPEAVLPLTGEELFELTQGGLSKKASVTNLISLISTPLTILADIDTNDPPDTSDTPTALLRYADLDGSVTLSTIGFNAASTFDLFSAVESGEIHVRGTNGAGNPVTFLELDPDANSVLSGPGGSVNLKPSGSFGVEARIGGGVFLGYSNNIQVTTVIDGLEIRGNSTNDPTSPGSAQNTTLYLANLNSSVVGQIDWPSQATMNIENHVYSGNLQLRATDTSGVIRTLFTGDPDGISAMYADGVEVLLAQGNGIVAIQNSVNNDVSTRLLQFQHASDTLRGQVGYDSTGDLIVSNLVHGGLVTLSAEDTGGVLRTLVQGDPDGGVNVYNAGTAVARTVAAASGGLEANNQSTGAGFERVLTTGDLASGSISALYVGSDPKVIAQSFGGILRGTSGFDGDPTLGEDQDTALDLQNFSGDFVASLFFDEVPDLTLRNYVYSGRVDIWGTDSVGGGVPMISANPNAGIQMYDSGSLSFVSRNDGLDLPGTSSNLPSAGGSQETYIEFQNDAQSPVGAVGFNNDADLTLDSYNHGANVVLTGEDAAGVSRTLFSGDPDGIATLYNAGVARFQAASGGNVDVLRSGNTDAEGNLIRLTYADGTLRGFLGFNALPDLYVENRVHGGQLLLKGENAGGTPANILAGNPDGAVNIYNAGATVARTAAAASGGFEVNNTLTGTGFERALTTGDISTVTSFVPTFTGFSAAPAAPTINYMIVGDLVFLIFRFSTGTSNATTFTINNVPAAIRPSLNQVIYIPSAINNGANVAGCTVRVQAASASWLFGMGHNNPSGGGWNAANAKGLGSNEGYFATYFLNHA